MRIHITPGPSHLWSDLDDVEVRWCFGCRKRTSHHWAMLDGPFDAEGFCWYDPTWSQRCDECGKDETRFPGC